MRNRWFAPPANVRDASGVRYAVAVPNDAASPESFRGQLPFCLAPSRVALILALACVARLAQIAADIGAALRALASTKIHSNAAHSSFPTVSREIRYE